LTFDAFSFLFFFFLLGNICESHRIIVYFMSNVTEKGCFGVEVNEYEIKNSFTDRYVTDVRLELKAKP